MTRPGIAKTDPSKAAKEYPSLNAVTVVTARNTAGTNWGHWPECRLGLSLPRQALRSAPLDGVRTVHRARCPNLQERINRALDVTRGMGRTIDSLMKLARLKGGIDETDPTLYDPEQVVRQLVAAEQERTGAQHRLEISRSDPGVMLHGDASLFEVLTSILIENAFRHTPAGGRISIAMTLQDDAFFTLTISNDAPDFDPSDAERIFRPFQRGKNTSVNSPGAGLGLALAKEIAYRIGATLELSAAMKVVTFELKLGGARSADR